MEEHLILPEPQVMGTISAGQGGKKKIAVLGATGRTGIQFVKLALEQGYAVRGICRNSERQLVIRDSLAAADSAKTEALELVEADVWSRNSLKDAIRGCDIVMCFLEFSHEFGGCFDPFGRPRL